MNESGPAQIVKVGNEEGMNSTQNIKGFVQPELISQETGVDHPLNRLTEENPSIEIKTRKVIKSQEKQSRDLGYKKKSQNVFRNKSRSSMRKTSIFESSNKSMMKPVNENPSSVF